MIVDHKDHIAKIIEILRDNIPSKFGLASIVLYGGFARGEGRMIESGMGKIPYGDYDLLIITKRSLPEDLIQRLLYDKIYREVMYGTSIDITNETVSSLKNINCDLSSYDLLKTGRTIWGEELLDRIKMDIEAIPILSFLRIINNRLNVILMEYGKRDPLRKSVIKLYLDIGGYLTFIHKVYSPAFGERIRNLRKIKLDYPGLIEKIELATGEKLNPAAAKDIEDREIVDAIGYGLKISQEIISKLIPEHPGSTSAPQIADLVYRHFPIKYYQGFIAQSFRGRVPCLKMMLPLLSLIANFYENIYFRRHSITRHRFSFGWEWRSPIIINMAITFLLVCFLIEEKKNYLKEAEKYFRKIIPGFEGDGFQKLKDINTELWLGYTRRARKRNLYKALSDLFVK